MAIKIKLTRGSDLRQVEPLILSHNARHAPLLTFIQLVASGGKQRYNTLSSIPARQKFTKTFI
ncbi:hypothetical protein A6A04_19445 [Paramagnetospirillum marisnigri]|uniref:Uncharacterized protein n=1 Tax=Paramagnetospirillum marisnigri TaxID=1285242 RepID=A0A178MLG8_9PROT|nr:hypothetical protein A6A04_19445 [Paramagnetospirillum marisnigri]